MIIIAGQGFHNPEEQSNGGQMNSRDNKKMTFWGASPVIFILTILYTIPIIIINHYLKPVFVLNFIPPKFLIAGAFFLLCIGIPLYIITLKELKAAYTKQELISTGIFSICRNPLFAIVIFLLLPTMWLRSRFALAVAKLPVWKQYEFFTAMFTIIKEDDKGRDNDIKSGEKV